MTRKILGVVAFAAVAALAGHSLAPTARAQSKKTEYVRIDLLSTFQPSPQNTASLLRGMLVMSDGEMRSGDWRIPADIPIGATVSEIGVIGQTSNRLAVKLERMDWTPVYAGTGTQPDPAGSWTAIELLERSMTRKVEKPKSDDENKPAPPMREKSEHEIDIVVYMSRDPNLSPEAKRAAAPNQRDRIGAMWLKIEHP